MIAAVGELTDGLAAAHRADPAPRLGALLRGRRRQLGLTLREVCARAGLSAGYLSQVENDKAVPTLGTLAQVAAALDAGLDYFVAALRPADALSRASGRARFSLPHSPVAYEPISADYPGSQLSSYILHVPPGYASELVTHQGEEMVVVLEGEVEHWLGEATMTLGPGDSLHFPGATPHAFANRGAASARVLWTGTLPVLRRRPPTLPSNDGKGRTPPTNRRDPP